MVVGVFLCLFACCFRRLKVTVIALLWPDHLPPSVIKQSCSGKRTAPVICECAPWRANLVCAPLTLCVISPDTLGDMPSLKGIVVLTVSSIICIDCVHSPSFKMIILIDREFCDTSKPQRLTCFWETHSDGYYAFVCVCLFAFMHTQTSPMWEKNWCYCVQSSFFQTSNAAD